MIICLRKKKEMLDMMNLMEIDLNLLESKLCQVLHLCINLSQSIVKLFRSSACYHLKQNTLCIIFQENLMRLPQIDELLK